MGKHTAKTGVAANRSRNRRDSEDIHFSKRTSRPKNRLVKRRRYYTDVLSKSPRSSRYKSPGSLKARTN